MNYEKQYKELIRKHGTVVHPQTGYFERHHIVPKSLGGSNDFTNLTFLSARCHLLAHWLLMKIHNVPSMRVAYATMCSRDGIRLTPIMYQLAREAVMGENSMVSRKVHTPKGWFGSVREAGRAHQISHNIISRKAKSKKYFHAEYYYEGGSTKDSNEIRQSGKHRSKRVHTPRGWSNSVRDAGQLMEMYHSTVSRRCRSDAYPEYFYEEECAATPVKMKRKIHTPLGWFDSVSAAARAEGLSGAGILSSRAKSTNWPEYYYSEQT